jgi:hypothetical protein
MRRAMSANPGRSSRLLVSTMERGGGARNPDGGGVGCASQAAKHAGAVAQEAAATAVEAAEARCVALSAAAAEEKRALEDTLAAVQAALTVAASKVSEGTNDADGLRQRLARASEEAQKYAAQAEAATEALDGALEAKAALQLQLKASISASEVCALLPPHRSAQLHRKA